MNAIYSVQYRHADGSWQNLPVNTQEARNSKQYRVMTADGNVLAYHNSSDACRADIAAVAAIADRVRKGV